MFAAVRNWPKCFLAILAFGVIGGHFQQLECKLLGCKSAPAVQTSSAEHVNGDNSAPAGDHHCVCQCHFNALAVVESPDCYTILIGAWSDYVVDWHDHAPEAPCADIEHPPQLA